MNRAQSITRLVVALTIAAAIGAQVPVQNGIAMADTYKRRNTGNFISAGLIGAILFKSSGKSKGTRPAPTPPPIAVLTKDCAKATLSGNTSASLLDNLGSDTTRFSGIRGLVGDCDEVLTSLKIDEPLTLLAPENGALSQVSPQTVALLRADKGKLCELLKDHILIGRYKYEDLCRLADGKKMLLLSGNTVTLGNKSGKVTLNGVEVVPMDIAASNGWVHPIKGLIKTTM
jgi:uncharacterized surface protein with fasciclin (FAS1) repeats